MKLIGNSVSVPVVQMLGKAIIETGVFENNFENTTINMDENKSICVKPVDKAVAYI